VIKAIQPHEVTEAVAEGVAEGNFLPDAVIEAVNELLIKNGHSRYITLKQNEVVTAILTKMEHLGVTRQMIFENHWLDFEPCYRKGGWEVEFDRPGYNESYEAYWKFTKP
jgi:hypothetical protein